MHRTAFQSACLVLLAVVLSAGSAANASMLITLPSGSGIDQNAVQCIDESGHHNVHGKSHVGDVTETRTERVSLVNRNLSDQIVTALIDFEATDHEISLIHTSVELHSLDRPFTQRRNTLANLPPPVR